MKYHNIRTFLVVCAVAVTMISCRTSVMKNGSSLSKEVMVQTLTVSESMLLTEREYVGVVEEGNNVLLSFSAPGKVLKVYVTEGQYVKKDAILAEIDPSTLENMHATTLASLKQAEDAYARLTKLYESNSLPEIQYVEIQTKLEQARAAERIAARALEGCKMTAPQSGIIGKKMIEQGMNVLPDQPVFSLMNTQAPVVKVAIPENEISDTHIGQNARIRIQALKGEEVKGRIVEKGVQAHPVSHSYEVRIALNGTVQGLLPGMVSRVYIQNLPERSAIVIPNHTILPMDFGAGYYVWVLDADNLVHKREIRLGEIATGGISVEEGLHIGDRLVVSGYHKISENIKVTVTNE